MDVSVPAEPSSLQENTESSQPENAGSTPLECTPSNDEINPNMDQVMFESNDNDVALPSQQSEEKTAEPEMDSTVDSVHQAEVSMEETNESTADVTKSNKAMTATKQAEVEVAEDIDGSTSFFTIPNDISKSREEGPTQPKLEAYPKTPIGGPGTARSRSFCSNWFNRFPWLEYSVSYDKVYCFACRHYGNGLYRPSPNDLPDKKIPLRKGATIYATIGFSRWAKAHERMQRHNSSARHLEAMGPWLEDTLNREKRNNSLNGTGLSENSQTEAFKELEKAAAAVNAKPMPSKRKRSRPTKKAVKLSVIDFDPALGCPTWCTCTKCIEMSRMHECVCCCDVPEIRSKIEALDASLVCITEHPGFTAICLNEWAIQVAYYHHKQESGTPAVSEEHERFRYIAYCQFVRWCWGYLREDMHIPLPSCVVNKIKATFHVKASLPALDDLPDSSQVLKD